MTRRRTSVLSMLAGAAMVAGTVLATSGVAAAGAPPGTPTAHSIGGVSTVGPLFRDGLSSDHGCTASVVDSPSRNLLLTAAHCVSGSAIGWLVAPGYDKGATPYGVWTVTAAYVPPQWQSGQSTLHDVAVLSVAPRQIDGRTRNIEDVTGGNVVASGPRPGQAITDVAYNAGLDDQAISCTVPTSRTGAYPTFSCHGYVGGSSGSPWLATVPGTSTSVVQGVIGGLHQGGCFDYTSYSSPFRLDVQRLVARAADGRHPDVVPVAGSDGC